MQRIINFKMCAWVMVSCIFTMTEFLHVSSGLKNPFSMGSPGLL